MLNYALYIQLQGLLGEISALTENLEVSAGSFSSATGEYLKKLAAFADENRLYFSSDIAVERDKLLTFKGTEASGGTSVVKRNLRKERDAFAVVCLETVNRDVKEYLEKDRCAYRECEDIIRQIISKILCKPNGLLELSPSEREKTVIAAAESDPEILPYFAHVRGLLGVFNLAALLGAVLPQLGL